MNADSPYKGEVERLHIDSEEDGFHLLVKTEDGEWFDFHIHDIAVDVLAEVKRGIGPWLDEIQAARATGVRMTQDDLSAYDLRDPKHPRYHEIFAGLHDDRDKS